MQLTSHLEESLVSPETKTSTESQNNADDIRDVENQTRTTRGLSATQETKKDNSFSSSSSSFKKKISNRRRSVFDIFNNANGGGAYCGMSLSGFLLRSALFILLPLYVIMRASISAAWNKGIFFWSNGNTIDGLFEVLIITSRFVSYVNKNQKPKICSNNLDIVETVFLIVGLTVVDLLDGSNAEGTLNLFSFLTSNYVGTVICYSLLLLPLLNLFIKQIMLAQGRAITEYVSSFVKKVAITVGMNLVLLFYTFSSLSPNQYSNNLPMSYHATKVEPIVLSKHYTCENKTGFVNYVSQFPEFQNSSICAQGSILDSTNDQWCGFDSWEEACWNFGTVPAMTAIKFDTMVIVFVGWTSILVDGVFIGRGIIKRKNGGGIDEGSFALLRRPRIVFAITCGSIITCIFFFSIADLIINGSFLNAPTPSVTSIINPRNLLPAKCYGECRSTLNIVFFSLWLLTMIAIGLEHFPTIKCCDCVIITIGNNSTCLS